MDVLVDSAELSQVARSWLERGADAFGVWRDGEPVVCWPADGEARGTCIRAVIGGHAPADELRAYGVCGKSAQARLNADAALLGRIVAADAELEALADDLLESQDQLVALYDLARSTKDLLSVDAVLASVTREAGPLVRAPPPPTTCGCRPAWRTSRSRRWRSEVSYRLALGSSIARAGRSRRQTSS